MRAGREATIKIFSQPIRSLFLAPIWFESYFLLDDGIHEGCVWLSTSAPLLHLV